VRTESRIVVTSWLPWLTLAWFAATLARADEPAEGGAPARGGAAVTLLADRVRYWDAGGARWVLLEGKAQVFTGSAGPELAHSALARIESRPRGEGKTARLDVYSLDLAASEDPLARDPLVRLTTTERLTLRARTADGVVGLDQPPVGFRALAVARPAAAESTGPRGDPPAVLEPDGRLATGSPTDAPAAAEVGTPPSGSLRDATFDTGRDVEPAAAQPPAEPAAPPASETPAPFANETAGAPASSAFPPSEPVISSTSVDAASDEIGSDARPDDAPPGEAGAPFDDQVIRVQVPGLDPGMMPGAGPVLPVIEEDPAPGRPIDAGGMPGLPTDLSPLPPEEIDDAGDSDALPGALLPESQRLWSISPRYGGRPVQVDTRPLPDGRTAYVIRGGVIMVSEVRGKGRVDLSADQVVLWTRPRPDGDPPETPSPSGGAITQDANQELEAYLEGDVIIRNDKMKYAGSADQTLFKAKSAYYDFRTERLVALDAEISLFAPGLISPIRTKSPLINQYREPTIGPDGSVVLADPRISAEQSTTTGSRFPRPGYRFDNRAVDITQIEEPLRDPYSGGELVPPRGPGAPKEKNWLFDLRQNLYYMGPVPVFYWPRIRATDDFDPPIRNLSFRYGNYFGYQVMTDWSGFKLLNIRRPNNVDNWNIDIDYLSLRGPALGSEIGWFGRDLFGDLVDPYGRTGRVDLTDQPYFGYFDVWGIIDHHFDVLGPGPAVVTNGPPGAGKAGFQRIDVPSFTTDRGRFLFRHMQSLVGPDAGTDEDFRFQLEAGAYSDRNFIEQYYKRLFDSGLDQDTLAYGIWQRRNEALTLEAQVNYMSWITDTQWLPKLEYYRIGDTLFDHLLSYSSNYGVDYANVHTANEVNNKNLFAFIPFDPITNTSGPWSSGRGWTTQQIEMPLNFDYFRIVPYGQGQLMGWTNQLDDQPAGRAWGAVGVRANIMAWRTFPTVESEWLNVHGLAHKINFDVDYRSAYSNLGLSRLGIQDRLDDDTYEWVRRYFALTNYVGGILPPQYDPRFLLLRRSLNPIAFSPDIQGSMETLTLALHQRLQTKRGPEGRRRIVDYMILDFQTTFFPNSKRDNFGNPMGQTMYNYEWYLGDRTSFVSTGWFEFWTVQGNPILVTEPRRLNDPFGLTVVTAGFSINRPPRGNVYIGYSIVNTGPIATSAMNLSYSYWLSPKWYSSFSMSYDFGNAILLGSTVSLTKISADYLTSIGLAVDPQRQNYTFGLEIAPRFSPTARLGSAVGTRFDSRFAPTQ
jgi:hypothetical protein